MPPTLRRLSALACLTLPALASALVPVGPAAGQAGGSPNVMIILTDDQRAMDTMEHMPKTLQWFGQGGTSFTEGVATTPLCCPSRAAIMSGRLNHNNNVRTNGDQELLDHNSTIQRYLDQAGYRTGLAGKFLNLWPVANNPPNFDRWALLKPEDTGYYNSQFNVDGAVQTVPGYSTDYIRDYTLDLLDTWEVNNDDRPWFLHVAPYAPHDPADPAARHAAATFPPWPGNPAVFEADRSDKPPSVRNARRTYEEALVDRERQLRTLLAVDEMVDAIFQRLEATGEQNTLAFFLSDNGFFWAEHGLRGKNRPYTEAIKVPFFMRWPGRVAAGGAHGSPAANIDLAPTILQAAGISPAAQYPLDGKSLLQGRPRKKMLAESWPPEARGPWASTRTPGIPRRCPGATGKPGHHLVGSQFRDSIGGFAWRNVICGRDGADNLRGKGGRDRLIGHRGPDTLVGGPGDDILDGKSGRDVCRGGPGKDRFRSCQRKSG